MLFTIITTITITIITTNNTTIIMNAMYSLNVLEIKK